MGWEQLRSSSRALVLCGPAVHGFKYEPVNITIFREGRHETGLPLPQVRQRYGGCRTESRLNQGMQVLRTINKCLVISDVGRKMIATVDWLRLCR
jgi:hypothetical protein